MHEGMIFSRLPDSISVGPQGETADDESWRRGVWRWFSKTMSDIDHSRKLVLTLREDALADLGGFFFCSGFLRHHKVPDSTVLSRLLACTHVFGERAFLAIGDLQGVTGNGGKSSAMVSSTGGMGLA